MIEQNKQKMKTKRKFVRRMKRGIVGGLMGIVAGFGLSGCETIAGSYNPKSPREAFSHIARGGNLSQNDKRALGIIGLSQGALMAKDFYDKYRANSTPENVIRDSNNNYHPAPGYTWVNPNNANDLRVRRVERNQTNQGVQGIRKVIYLVDRDGDGVAETAGIDRNRDGIIEREVYVGPLNPETKLYLSVTSNKIYIDEEGGNFYGMGDIERTIEY